MKLGFKILVGAIIFFASTMTSAKELISVTGAVDKQAAYIGDLIEYSIEIRYDSTVTLTPPAVGANLGGFEVKNYNVGEEVRLEDGDLMQRMEFTIRTFTTGEYVIPPLPIEYMLPDSTFKYISANPIKIEIKSVLADENSDTLQIKPLKPQATLEKEGGEFWVFVIAGVLLLGGGAIAYYYYRKSKIEPVVYVDPRPEWEIAYADLALLKESSYLNEGQFKKFYIELSEIMRKYLGRRFDFLSTDLTTEEIDVIITGMIVDQKFQNDTIQFLAQADLVKFAKFVPDDSRTWADWQVAYDLITVGRELVMHRKLEVNNADTAIGAEASADDVEYDDPMIKFAPPELRQRLVLKASVIDAVDDSDEGGAAGDPNGEGEAS